MTRHDLRDRLFRFLYRLEFHDQEEMEEQLRLFLEDRENGPADEEAAEYLRTRYEKLRQLLPEIDSKIDAQAVGWDKTRMGKAELAILRLAVYEMCFDEDIPESVAINEAVELAKKYGNEESAGGFVNAVLSKIMKAEEKA